MSSHTQGSCPNMSVMLTKEVRSVHRSPVLCSCSKGVSPPCAMRAFAITDPHWPVFVSFAGDALGSCSEGIAITETQTSLCLYRLQVMPSAAAARAWPSQRPKPACGELRNAASSLCPLFQSVDAWPVTGLGAGEHQLRFC
eukprot:1150908-Pelagomonas_calceolata.AAC.2